MKFVQWVLFLAGMLAGAGAGHLFYMDRYVPGGAFLALTAVFLGFATRARPAREEPEERPGVVDDAALVEMALFLAEVAINGLKGVGRTVPPTIKEIDQLEGRLNVMLDRMGAPSHRRKELKDEVERLKGRVRRNEGGLALARSVRL